MEKTLRSYIKKYKIMEPELCDSIVKDIEGSADWEQHWFYQPKTDKRVNLSGNKELDTSFSVSPNYEDIVMKKIWDSLLLYVEELNFPWAAGWTGYSKVRWNRYVETRVMAEHCDHIHSLFDGERKGVPIWSILGMLSDDYEGGELVFFQDEVIEFNKGEIMVFPSNFLFPHRVEPVKSGVRHSFVSWAW